MLHSLNGLEYVIDERWKDEMFETTEDDRKMLGKGRQRLENLVGVICVFLKTTKTTKTSTLITVHYVLILYEGPDTDVAANIYERGGFKVLPRRPFIDLSN